MRVCMSGWYIDVCMWVGGLVGERWHVCESDIALFQGKNV